MVRHFLTLRDLDESEFRALIQRACELKTEFREKRMQASLPGRTLGMIFEKSSTRTRVSFEAAIAQLGGHPIFLSPGETQLGRGEPVEDTARVLSKMVDCIMVRTFQHSKIEKFAEYSDIPVINGLSDTYHPCQLLADMQTFFEERGDIKGKKVAWLGDGNNMCHSYINAASILGFDLHIASPDDYRPEQSVIDACEATVVVGNVPEEAVSGADLVVTDVWASMGQESESDERMAIFKEFQVNARLMQEAKPEAIFMHCLPAHRGEEVSADIIDGPQSVVWEEAGNRLHSQKALLEFLMS